MRVYNEILKYWNYILYSSRSKLRAEVAGSYLNWIWWILEPFCLMIIYTVIFGHIFGSEEQYFPLYIFIGNTMWAFFSRTMASSVMMIKSNDTIIAKVYMPKYILLLVEMFVNMFKMLVSFGLTAIMMILFRVPVSINIVWIIPVMIVFFVITFGISAISMHFGVYINDLSYAIGILLNMMMYFTGIFFSIENKVVDPFGSILGIGNPVAFLLTSARKSIIYAQTPDLLILLIWFVIGIIISGIGLNLIYKNENSYVKIM